MLTAKEARELSHKFKILKNIDAEIRKAVERGDFSIQVISIEDDFSTTLKELGYKVEDQQSDRLRTCTISWE